MRLITNNQKNSKKYFFTKFFPNLKSKFGNKQAALIAAQLEYWFGKYPDGFYKFMEPCSHPAYNEGDSWSEELSLHRKTFNHAFDLIGARYKSKTDFLKSPDTFKGKIYASYYDRNFKKTFYFRNHEQADLILKNRLSHNDTKRETEKPEHLNPKSPLQNGKNFRSLIYKDKQRLYTDSPKLLERNPEFNITEKILIIWNKETALIEKPSCLSAAKQKNLNFILNTCFQNDLEKWTEYCRKIAHNRFLMGGGERGWKANLDWAIKPDNIQKVQAGYYTGQKEESHAVEITPLKIEEIEELQGEGDWQEILRRLARRIGLHTFKSWFTGLMAIDLGATHLRLKTSSNFKKDRIRSHYYHDLIAAIQSVLPNVQGVDLLA